MGIFPENYSKPELVSILKASELGWCSTCNTGGGPISAKSSDQFDQGHLFDGEDGNSSTNSRLINPGDVSQGL